MGKAKRPASKAKPSKTVAAPSNKDATVSIRKISNGFLVTESSMGGRGGFRSTERFFEKKPIIKVK
jgi:hypothetical protein